MAQPLTQVFAKIKAQLRLPNGADLKVFDRSTGFPISRKKEVRPIALQAYLRDFDKDTRVATFLLEIERRIGSQVGARLELWLAGHRVDGRRKVAGL